MKFALCLLAISALGGCAWLAGHLSLAPEIMQAAQVADAGKLGADIAAIAHTGRSLTDHAISRLTAKDCAGARVLAGEPYCIDSERGSAWDATTD